MKKINNKKKIFFLVFAFFISMLLISYKSTFAIYRNTFNVEVDLTVLDPSTTFVVSFDSKGNGDFDSVIRTYGQAIGNLPKPQKEGYNFNGWFTEETGGTKINKDTPVTKTTTYHAQYTKIVCKMATELHKYGSTNFGTIPNSSTFTAGFAYDCDVNGDDEFSSSDERFYYLTTDDDSNAVLIYSNNAHENNTFACDAEKYLYNDQRLSYNPPTTAYQLLPDATFWSNVELHNLPRQIKNQDGGTVAYQNTSTQTFSYTGKSSRFATTQEIAEACNITRNLGTTSPSSEFSTCGFLLENTARYNSNCRSNYWLETPLGGEGLSNVNKGFRIDKSGYIASVELNPSDQTLGFSGVRPVIEVPIDAVEFYGDSDVDSYTVTFDSQGGSNVESISRLENQAVGTLPVPVKEGYTFDGWYTDTTYETEVTSSTLVTADVIYYAKWTEIVDDLVTVFHIPGTCTFNGKPTNENNNYITSNSNDCIDVISNTDYLATGNNYIDTGISLYSEANYLKDYEIGFNIVAYDGSAQTELQVPFVNTKLENSGLGYPGLTFRRGSNANQIEIAQTINKVKKSAKLTFTNPITTDNDPIPVVITRTDGVVKYSFNGGEFVTLQDVNGTSDYFNFHTWFGASGAGGDASSTTYTAQRYLKATLQDMYVKLEADENEDKYTVTFNPTGGHVSPTTKLVDYDAAVGTLPTPTRTGYTFDGWYTEETGGTKVTTSTIVSSDITYYAHWNINSYTITFNSTGGSESYPITKNYNEAIGALDEPTKTGYTFDGWYTEETGGTKITEQTIVTGNATYYAHWNINSYTISFNTYGGSAVADITKNYNEAIGTLPTTTKDGYALEGWYTEETGGTKITEETLVTSNKTYHAHYLPAVTVTFNPDGGTASFTTKAVATGTAIGELPTAEKGNYIFDGWYDLTYTNLVTTDIVINADVTYIAKWIPANNAAIIDSTGVYYSTLQEAVTAATNGTNTEIRLLKDVEEKVTIALNKDITLDLQSFTVSNSSSNVFVNNGKLEIKNGTISGTANAATIDNKAGATLNITGGTITATNNNTIVNNGGTINISNGTIGGSASNSTTINNKTGTVTISGGILSSTIKNVIENTATMSITAGSITTIAPLNGAINNNTNGVLNISGGSVSTSGNKQALYNDGGTATISGTAILSNDNNQRAAVQNNKGTMYIIGGTIIAKKYMAVNNSATLTIGKEDLTIDNTTPVIQGFTYGVTTTGNFNFYDGIIKGYSAAIDDESYAVLNGTYIEHGTETIDTLEYKTAYLIQASDVYTVTFNSNGGSAVDSIQRTVGSEIGTLPTTTKSNVEFLGWYTEQIGGNKVFDTTEVTDDVTYYAHFTTSQIVCKKATTLHEYNDVTYGTIQSGPTIKSGDAFDCDVNGDSTYDASTERFYYLTDDENGNAVFIYYNNTSQSDVSNIAKCNASGLNYSTSPYINGPTTAYTELPTTTQWSNVGLYSTPRQIVNENGTTSVGSNTATKFEYTGKSARFATLDEIKTATVSTLNGTNGELSSYSYLYENLASNAAGTCRSNYWLETPLSNGNTVYRVSGANKMIENSSNNSAVRPVIEVPYDSIEIEKELVIFDTIPTAMRTYFNNISTWASGQTDDNHSSYDTYMTNNLNTNNCVYFAKDSDNVEIEYGSNYCDQPNKYDTGVSGNVNVYTYDADTNTRGSLATYVTSDEGKLYNMIPNQIYYWESAADSSINGYVKPIGERRIISIDNSQDNTVHKVRNVRDLGGIKVDTDGDGTTDGTIKYAKLYRGTRIWGGDGNTKPYFDKLGISNEVDLRESNEPDASLEDKLTNYYLKTIIHYNIAYADDATNGNYTKARNTAIFIMNQFIEAHENGDDDYAMFFHCRVGADRTGTIAYILEGLLGASEEERYRDYEMTVFFGLRERTRFYYSKGSNTVKFQFMKNAFKATSNNNTEDVLAWFLAGSSDTEADMQLVNKFRNVMIDYN